MKHLLLTVLSLAVVVLAGGCSLKEKYSKNNSAAEKWLRAGATVPASANFEGVYYTPDWGVVLLNQNKDKLTGSVAHMRVDGVVSGNVASLLLIDDQWVEYTAVLKRKNSEVLQGSYSPSIPYSSADASPMVLEKITR